VRTVDFGCPGFSLPHLSFAQVQDYFTELVRSSKYNHQFWEFTNSLPEHDKFCLYKDKRLTLRFKNLHYYFASGLISTDTGRSTRVEAKGEVPD
jgi:hypothetical protein